MAKRTSIAFSVSTLVTLVIFGVWMMTFTRTDTSKVATSQTLESRDQSASPLQAVEHAVGSIFDGTKSVYERE